MSTNSLPQQPSGVNTRVVIFQSGLATRLGTDAGLLMSQALYWYQKKPNSAGFWHSLNQWQAELGCDWLRKRHAAAVKKLVAAGLLKCNLQAGRATRYLPNLSNTKKLLAKSTAVDDLYETLYRRDRVKAITSVKPTTEQYVSNDTTPNLAGYPVPAGQGSQQTLSCGDRVPPLPCPAGTGSPKGTELKDEHSFLEKEQQDRAADGAVDSNSEEEGKEEDDLDYGTYSINSIQSPEIRALLSAAVSSQAAAVRQATGHTRHSQ